MDCVITDVHVCVQGDRGNPGTEGLAGVAGSPGTEGPVGFTGGPGQIGEAVSKQKHNKLNPSVDSVTNTSSAPSWRSACFEFRAPKAPLDPKDNLEYGGNW